MAKRIQIGGRIESKEVGGIVTGAAEILDDAKGKNQSVVNQETDTELERLDQSKQDNLTFDNAPTEGSDNPVKSGGVYAADKALSDAIEAILLLIPSAASGLNKLVDTAMMNSSISTATATFRGTYNVVTDLELAVDATHEQIAAALGNVISTADNNDYAFVQIPVSAESTDIRRTERYKFNGTAWGYEYDLNTSGFTAAQWAAINSGITLALVGKLIGLPTSSELQELLGQKQDTLTFDNIPTSGSANPVKSGGVYSAINEEKTAREQLAQSVTGINGRLGNVEDVIPSGAAANNKLVANNSMEAYVTSIIEAITASFTIATADGHINLTLTQTNGRVASLTLTSSDIASAQALTALTGRVSTAESDITTLGGRVSTNETDIANLQQLYNNLQQSKPEPVTALPSTGQQQGVIYRLAGTNSYSDYMWNGSTWVLMATYNNAIDPRPKKASLNLVTSGGVFDNMGALDVSELNATENPHTLAQYVDLSAALAAIPTDYQKGGMSIKFVQSSDNKYVQYRCISDEWSLYLKDWINIEQLSYTNTAYEPQIIRDGFYISPSDGSRKTDSNFAIFEPIPVKSGDVVYANISCNYAVCPLAFSLTDNTAGDMSSTPLIPYSSSNIYQLVVPQDGYLFVSAFKNTSPSLSISSTTIKNIFTEIKDARNGINGKLSIFNEKYIYTINGFYANAVDGQISFSHLSSYKCKCFLINKDSYIRVNLKTKNYSFFGVICDSDGTNATLLSGAVTHYIKVSSNQKRLYINYNNNNENDIEIQSLNVYGEYDSIEPLTDVVDKCLTKQSNINIHSLVLKGWDDQYINSSGQRIYLSGFYITKPIPVKRGDFIQVSTDAHNTVVCPVAFCPNIHVGSSYMTPITTYVSYNKYLITIENDGYIFISNYSSSNAPSVIISRIEERNDVLSQISPWYGKKIAFLGDSITMGVTSQPSIEGDYTSPNQEGLTTKPFCRVACDIIGALCINYGETGTSISSTSSTRPEYSFTNRYTDIDTNVDAVIIAGGTNDYGTEVALGSISDTTDISFYGALNVLCEGLIQRFVGKPIIFITPIKRTTEGPRNTGLGSLQKYREAIYKVCAEKYGLKVIDGTMLGMSPACTSWKNLYMYDGLHPGVEGHIIYGENLAKVL